MSDKLLNIADFTYELPDDRIARYPLPVREQSKLLHYQNGQIADYHFTDLPALLPPATLLIGNATKVIHARLLLSTPSDQPLEIFCLDPIMPSEFQQAFSATSPVIWKCLVGGNRRWLEGEAVLKVPLHGEVIMVHLKRLEVIGSAYGMEFSWDKPDCSFGELLSAAGKIPLPPYLGRAPETIDEERYQTVFAQAAGSVAAPTAALHLSEQLLARLRQQNMNWSEIILHVGAGTFKPVFDPTIGEHEMHAEFFEVGRLFLRRLIAQLRAGSPIIAVGTTTTRCLESLYYLGSLLLQAKISLDRLPVEIEQWVGEEYTHTASPLAAIEAILEHLLKHGHATLKGSTRLMISPGIRPKMIDGLITNFHQPTSTLLLIVAAVTGNDWRKIYAHALAKDYRFLSYGDGSLLMMKKQQG